MKKSIVVLPLLVTVFANTSYADQVILDDLIVDGSECIGQDCVNGESFGFDTLRLKENNLRIKAQDTSSTASFPTNDWQITFNDSANGGANKFSIDDIDSGRTIFTLEAGAPSNSLYVDDGGRVGLGTSTPVVQLHIKDGNTPTTRLEQDGSSGFTAQTWDVAGNEANFFIRDATNGSTLPFRIFPSAPSSSLVIEGGTGHIGVGTTAPDDGASGGGLLEIKSSDDSNARLSIDGGSASNKYGEVLFQENNSSLWSFGYVATDNRFYLYNYTRGAYDLAVNDANGYFGLGGVVAPTSPIQHANGALLTAGGIWQNASSRELKDDITILSTEDAVAALQKLKPVTFRYKADPEDMTVGFIAEDVPELVATQSHKTLSAMDIVAVLTKVMQEQQSTIAGLQKQLNEVNEKLNRNTN